MEDNNEILFVAAHSICRVYTFFASNTSAPLSYFHELLTYLSNGEYAGLKGPPRLQSFSHLGKEHLLSTSYATWPSQLHGTFPLDVFTALLIHK